MRKITIYFIAVIIFCSVGKAQYVSLPDTNFRNTLRNSYPGCFNGAGQMDTTCSEIVNADYLSFDSYFTYITNFEGLQYFKRLKHFDCREIDSFDIFPSFPDSLVTFTCQSMRSLPVLPLPASLKYFDCSYSYYITALPPLPAGLERLELKECGNLSVISSLPISLNYLNMDGAGQHSWGSPIVLPALPPGLDTLSCRRCLLTSLPALPNGITYVNCSSNNITRMPALPNSISFLDCSDFRYVNWSPEDTSRIDMPALPSNLKYFNCQYSGFRTMQPLPPGLETLYCNGVPVNSSIIFPSTLKILSCAGCGIRSFPATLPLLQWLDCSNNPLYTIPSFSDSLIFLSCGYDSLSSLPALPAGINYINCHGNQLTSLPALPINLDQLHCGSNRLTTLPALPNKLTRLGCSGNRLTALPVLPDTLNDINCQGNLLTSLPALPSQLTNLSCSNNQLTHLPELPPALRQVDCQSNNIYCLPKIPQTVNALYIFCDWKINCIPNASPYVFIQRYDTATGISLSGLPLCNPTNNSSHCQAYPVMQGNIFFDINNNGIKDSNEPFKINTRINLTSSGYTFSNSNGQFEIAADSIGNFALSAVAPRYYQYIPASYNFNFINYDTLITNRNFALQIDSIVDELTIKITPINWAARPGFSFPYMISYENTGTTTLLPDIIFDYDQTRLNYNTSSVAGVTDNANSLTYNPGSLQPGESGSFIGYFTLKTTVPIGDTLNAKATISANSFTAYDSVQTIVRGAFDPNDKQATPQLSPSQVANGEYIDYTIRFQNTGTDTAFTVVISDTLSNDLQKGTLEMIASSHNCKTTVKDNVIFFEFLNILLPDSNINEPLSHGFVSFRIKPQPTVAVNTTIPNSAAIYFDYNAPVITNTAGTLIKEFTIVPLKLIAFSAVPQNDNTVLLNWNTTNEINSKHFVIERSNDGRSFTAVATVLAKGGENNYYHASVADANTGIVFYRLQMMDNDGTLSYSPIVKIDRRKNAAGFSVLTNPVNNFLIINTTDRSLHNTQASIINMQGAVVKTFILKEGSQTIDIKSLPMGVYYLRTVNGSSRIVIN